MSTLSYSWQRCKHVELIQNSMLKYYCMKIFTADMKVFDIFVLTNVQDLCLFDHLSELCNPWTSVPL